MKIASYNLGMESKSTYTQKYTLSKRMMGGQIGAAANNLGGYAGLFDKEVSPQNQSTENGEQNTTSENQKTNNLYDQWLSRVQNNPLKNVGTTTPASSTTGKRTDSVNTLQEFRAKLIQYLYELFTGKKDTREVTSSYMDNMPAGEDMNYATITYEENVSYEEYQEYSFSTTGTVVNSEGQAFNFNIEVGMSRSFYQSNVWLRSENVALCDPLVINYGGDCAKISDQKFFFDLDCDGEEEEISNFKQGTGMLAMDLNEDGKINDGSELFGTKSGNGFADLAKYDEDGNGWIDENDSAWDKIKIWVKNEDGTDTLYSLKEKNIGAIYLSSSYGEFDYKNTENITNARLRSTGIFLYENGGAGTLQQIDLAK